MATVALVGAGCIADDPDPNAAIVSSGGAVEISMSEFAYLPSTLTLFAGSTVTITLINDGFVAHEFMVGQTRAEGGGYDQDLLVQVLEDAGGSGFSTAGVALGNSEDPEEAMADEHAEDAMTDEHAEDAMTDEHAEDAMTDEHAEDAMADEHAEDAMTDAEMAAMDGGGHAHAGATIMVEPGGRASLTLHFPDDAVGTWEFGCFIEGHYDAGMHGSITVQPPIS